MQAASVLLDSHVSRDDTPGLPFELANLGVAKLTSTNDLLVANAALGKCTQLEIALVGVLPC